MHTTTRIDVLGHDSPVVSFRHGALQVRRLRDGGTGVRLGLVAGQALLLAGDHVRIEVGVTGPAHVEIVEMAGTVAYDMRGGAAGWDVAVELSQGASLSWEGLPFVVAAGADVARDTHIVAGAGCRAVLRETLVLGRDGEVGGTLHTRTRVELAGTPLLVEDLDLCARSRAGWATLHGHRCLDSVTSIGQRLPDAAGVLQLEGQGSIRRWIGNELHRSSLGEPGSGALVSRR